MEEWRGVVYVPFAVSGSSASEIAKNKSCVISFTHRVGVNTKTKKRCRKMESRKTK